MKTDTFNAELDKLMSRMREILVAKGHDYAGADDRFSNFRLCEAMGIPVWKGIVIRMSDKLSRIMCFAKTDAFKVKDESVEDTLLDLANYCLLCLCAYREEAGKRGSYKGIQVIEVPGSTDAFKDALRGCTIPAQSELTPEETELARLQKQARENFERLTRREKNFGY